MVVWGAARKGIKQSLVMASLREFRKRLCGTELDVATFTFIHMCHKKCTHREILFLKDVKKWLTFRPGVRALDSHRGN